MARGFLSGVLWGGIFGLGVSGVVSVLAPGAVQPTVSATAPGSVETPDAMPAQKHAEPAVTVDDAPTTDQPARQAQQPQADSPVAIDPGSAEPGDMPLTGEISDLSPPGDSASSTGGAAPDADEPVLPMPQALAPMAPQDRDEPGIDTETAALPAPPAEPVTGAFGAPEQPQTTPGDDTANRLVIVGDTNPDATEAPDAPAEAPMPDAPPVEAEAPAPPTPTAPSAVPTDLPDVAEKPDTPQPEIAALSPPAAVTDPDRSMADEAETPEPATAPESDADRPGIGTPVTNLTERPTAVPVRRPGTGDETETLPDGTADAGTDARPIVAFAQSFEPTDDKPLMSIVLIDDGTSPVDGAAGIAALRSFPYPISFAIDTSLPDAADRMAIYRASGFDVLAMVDLPQGATPADAETTFGVVLPQMSEVVGVLEGTGAGLQGSRDVSDQVTAILAQSGHGLVTQDKGLNTMPKLARKEGVPADPVFRDFDSKDQTATVIRRFLDQAAFKAGQEGAVIMLGRLRPDTISALLLWGLQDRASSVTLAPVSALLMRDG